MTHRLANLIRFVAARKRRFGAAAIAILVAEGLAAAALVLFVRDRSGEDAARNAPHGASFQISAERHGFGATLRVF